MSVVVESERLLLRKWNDEDAAAVEDIYLKPEVMKFIPGGVWSPERTARVVARMRELDIEQGFGFYPVVLKSLGKIIGHCGLGFLEQTPEIEVAYTWILAIGGNAMLPRQPGQSSPTAFRD